MGGNASTGLGGDEVYRGLRDVRSMGTDERPTEVTEDTNRKSLFPVSKTPHTNIMSKIAIIPNT